MGVDMIFIFLLALVLFGPKRLPEIAREVGKFMAEFRRASNDFKYQLQAEIDKAGATPPASSSKPAAQQSTPSAPVVLPPAEPAAAPDANAEHERLLKTARMAFEAQNFTLRPPEPPPVPSSALQPPAEPNSDAGTSHAGESNAPSAPSGTSGRSQPSAPAKAVTAPAESPAAGNPAALHNS